MGWPDTKSILLGLVTIVAAAGIIIAPRILSNIYGGSSLEAASVITSGLLSLALVILYLQQYRVLNRQTELMERDFESSLAHRGIVTAEKDTVYVNLRNVGRGTIQYVYLRSEIVSNTGSVNLEPGRFQMRRVEDDTRSLDSFCELSEFEGEVMMLIEDNDRGEIFRRPFRYIAGELLKEDIERCTLSLTLEIVDEIQGRDERLKEIPLAKQEVRVSRKEEQTFETDGSKEELQEVTYPNSVSKGLGPNFATDADILPRGSPFSD